jgi:lipopolysaccharide export LptBFGC system permease protein LptF
MKILDRYLLSSFIRNYLLSFLVLVGLYIALDMVFNFTDVIEPPRSASGPSLSALSIISDIVLYYAYQTPLIFVYLSGMIAVVGAAFTLMRLSRCNELTAMLAAGISLRRVALPIFFAGVTLNVLLIVDQELIIPSIIPKLIRSHDDMHVPTPKTFTVDLLQDDHNGLVRASRYTPPDQGQPATMEVFDVIERDGQLLPCGHLVADAAVWDDHARLWRLTNGTYTKILRRDETQTVPPAPAFIYQSDVTPDEIAIWRRGQYVSLLSTHRIDELLQRPKSFGVTDLLRTKNFRFTQPISNVILLLLAMPAVLAREPGRLKLAAAKCLLLSGICMGTIFLAYQLAGAPQTMQWVRLWPAMMAWTPIFIFGPLAVLLLDRLKT